MCIRSGYNRLSKDCSLSERDGRAQIQTMISMPGPKNGSYCRKGTAMKLVWEGRVLDLRYTVVDRL